MSALKSVVLLAALSLGIGSAEAGQESLVIEATPFAQKIFCQRNPGQCRVRPAGGNVAVVDGGVILNAQRMTELERVNQSVNARIKPRAEGAADDRWQIGVTSGDCEEYVLAKRQMLIKMGWPSSSVLISKVRTGRGQLHAVLLVQTNGGSFVLDNLSGSVRPASAVPYTWISAQTPHDPMKWHKVSGKF